MGFRKGKLDLGGGAVPQAANSGQAVGPEAALSRTQSLAVVLWAATGWGLDGFWQPPSDSPLLAAPFWRVPEVAESWVSKGNWGGGHLVLRPLR